MFKKIECRYQLKENEQFQLLTVDEKTVKTRKVKWKAQYFVIELHGWIKWMEQCVILQLTSRGLWTCDLTF